MILCDKCKRPASERNRFLAGARSAIRCDGPIHDLADRVGDLIEAAAPIHRGFERLLVIANRNANNLDLRGDEPHYLDHVRREFEGPLRSGEWERADRYPG